MALMLGVATYEEGLAAIGAEIDRRQIAAFIIREEQSFAMVTPLRKDETGQQSLRIEVAELGSLVSRWRSTPATGPATWSERLRRLGSQLDASHAVRPVMKLQADGGYASYRPDDGLPVRINVRFESA